MEYYSAFKRKEILPRNEAKIHYTKEVGQPEWDKCHMVPSISARYLKEPDP